MTSSLRARWGGAIALVAVIGLLGASVALGAAVASPARGHLGAAAGRHLAAQGAAKVTEFATGFNDPRGLRFGPNGKLYVAEGGKGGSLSSVGACPQVVEPIGPYTGGHTGRISVVSHDGHRRTLIEHLPSSQTSPDLGGLVSGVADVDFIGHHLYALLAGAGCSHGLVGTNNKVLLIRGHHKESVANLSEFIKLHPVANPEADDFEPDGTFYSMTSVHGSLYVVEPNHGEVDAVNPDVSVSRLIDISATQGHIVPTAIAHHGNSFYVGNLNVFPIVPGSSSIYRIDSLGQISVFAPGLTTVVGVAFDSRGRLYALENTTGNPAPTPGTGDIVRWTGSGWKTIASGLNLPTAMTFGRDGNLYVSVCGFGCPPGAGAIDKVHVEH